MSINRKPLPGDEVGLTMRKKRPRSSRTGRRRGLALMIVMVAISASLVITLSLMRTQTTALQIRANGSRRHWALEAARTGIAVGLQQARETDWGGISQQLSRVVHSDSDGTVAFEVTYLPYGQSDPDVSLEDAALLMVVRSEGTWTSLQNAQESVSREIEVVVRLRPRVSGRTILPGDSAAASDQQANPGDYDTIQQYALFAGGGSDSLVLDPGDRIEGDIWLYRTLDFYNDPHWNSVVRTEMLKSMRDDFVASNGIWYPHPLAGDIDFYTTPTSAVQLDLSRLAVSWSQTNVVPTYPTINFSDWTTYRLYEGGQEYSAEVVTSPLQNVTLRPSVENPLGIFYCGSNIQLGNDVTIQGTLVAKGLVSIVGENVYVGGFNWKGPNGVPLVANAKNWPRLPAIVARNVSVDRSIQAYIDGAIVVKKTLKGAGGDFEYVAATDVNIIGTATSAPVQQPWSEVDLQGTPDLSAVAADGNYAIFLSNGNSGNWYTIVGVDAVNNQLTVIGEVEHAVPTSFRIRRRRLRHIEIRGPVSGKRIDINRPPAWAVPSAAQWTAIHDVWDDVNDALEEEEEDTIPFIEFLVEADLFAGWPNPISEHGLTLEPTFCLSYSGDKYFRWSPPLFEPFDGSGPDAEFSGYRWEVVSWRELP